MYRPMIVITRSCECVPLGKEVKAFPGPVPLTMNLVLSQALEVFDLEKVAQYYADDK